MVTTIRGPTDQRKTTSLGGLDHTSRPSPHSSRHRQSVMALSFRRRPCPHAERLWQKGAAAISSTTARLPGIRPGGRWLATETNSSVDDDFRYLPTVLPCTSWLPTRHDHRPAEPHALATKHASSRSRTNARQYATNQWPVESKDGWGRFLLLGKCRRTTIMLTSLYFTRRL